ncbi:MAG: alpha/beta hydrolase [Gammaproteobacteria bacterium HGW-Gammaproteobacteria-11]|nr:MAG: alpha/beta hydrolase [Gammaproteobacteria bacterium HGW-Gammaproteobacteria-11]
MHVLKKSAYLGLVISAIALGGCLSGGGGGGGGGGGSSAAPSAPLTPQQQRIANDEFQVNLAQVNNFTALAETDTELFSGAYFVDEEETREAGFRIEVPADWNGKLVMWTHGFRGEGTDLTVDSPPEELRRWLIENNYAWAASSYSANSYNVQVGVEDTNALALAFNELTGISDVPSQYLISGVSMGGHIAGAAVELETRNTANNYVEYAGAAPFCGVMGDTALFDYFTAYSLALYELAGVGATSFPVSPEDALVKLGTARSTLWTPALGAPVANTSPGFFPYIQQVYGTLNEDGQRLFETLKNLSGGERPFYNSAYSFGAFQDLLQSFAGADGTVTGILFDSVVDTRDFTYRFENPLTPSLSFQERLFNQTIVQAEAVPGANGLRDDGLRLIPVINGEFDVPVLTMHTLGDLFVPFSMQQIYYQRALERGNEDLLVQRAIRSPGHCEFSQAEFVQSFSDLVSWVETGVRPAGDVVNDPEVVADANYGCTFTIDGPSPVPGFRSLASAAEPCEP